MSALRSARPCETRYPPEVRPLLRLPALSSSPPRVVVLPGPADGRREGAQVCRWQGVVG